MEFGDDIAGRTLGHGRDEVARGITHEPERSLAILEYADELRRAADQLSRESALEARAQGAEHRFSPSARERRSKASKAEWAQKERRSS
jgi:uncharacterized protein with von Willebrand factor type A (vWA) domain